ncbi:MAG: TIGR04255 family protein [Euryarchaeota archaeon]|nr:TIGR04255 family protein [Euryarchaeota archaeon]
MVDQQSKKRVYESHFLTNVVFRVDFPKILELSEQKPPSKFQEKISENYPIVNEVKGEFHKYQLKQTLDFVETNEKISWDFSNKEKTKRVFIDSDFVFIEYLKYEHFDDLFQDVKLIFETLIDLYPVKITKRVGLRYINQIKIKSGDPIDWNGLIHPSLFSVSGDFISSEHELLRSMHYLELKEEGYNLKFQFGLFNSEYPNPISRKEFILDYDCSTNEEIDILEILDKAKEFNKKIHEWFEKSILDDLRDIMGVVK